MSLKPEVSIPVSLAVGAVVLGIYNNAVPSLPDIRVGRPNDPDIAAPRKMAAWTAAGTVAAISLIAKDPNIFIVGGALTVAVDWWVRHAHNHTPMADAALPGGAPPVALQEATPDATFMSGIPA